MFIDPKKLKYSKFESKILIFPSSSKFEFHLFSGLIRISINATFSFIHFYFGAHWIRSCEAKEEQRTNSKFSWCFYRFAIALS